jgi:hypothetical protein
MFHRTLVRGLILWSLTAPLAESAVWLQAGESVIEQGDFLLHPAVQFGLGFSDGVRYRLDFSGRTFGSFLETTTMISRDELISVFPWPALQARYGVTVLDSYIAYDPPRGPRQNSHDFNVGLTLGLAYTIWDADSWRVNAEWNSHLYAAGASLLLLTTARKSVLTLGAEVAL